MTKTSYYWLPVIVLVLLFILFLQSVVVSPSSNSIRGVECKESSHQAIVMPLLVKSKIGNELRSLGGLSHPYHLLERLLHELVNEEEGKKHETDVLYIIFQDKESISSLCHSKISILFLTSILSRGGYSYKSIYIGLSTDLSSSHLVAGQKECMYDFHHYITLHVPIQENIEIHDEPRHVDTVAVTITRIFEWQKNINNRLYYFAPNLLTPTEYERIYPHHLQELQYQRHNNLHLFRKYVWNMCGLDTSPHATTVTALSNSSQFYGDELLPVGWISHKLRKYNSSLLTPTPYRQQQESVHHTKIFIYQRNENRKLLNNKDLQRILRTNPRSVVEIYEHQEDANPCHTISSISKADVFITVHGFQSILFLFQPNYSLFIELFPFLYYRPYVYGYIQAGIRHFMKLPRLYLSVQSTPVTEVSRYGYSLLNNIFNCLDYSFCRYLLRHQDVQIPAFELQRIYNFVNKQF